MPIEILLRMEIMIRIKLKEQLWLSGEFRGDQIDEIVRRMDNGYTFDNASQSVLMVNATFDRSKKAEINYLSGHCRCNG